MSFLLAEGINSNGMDSETQAKEEMVDLLLPSFAEL